ncbi:MAG: hypothetical protein JXR40_07630 [Pontiellaceae bacterium]|nr:hypothetical protein [Pontiellaceae bacterium]
MGVDHAADRMDSWGLPPHPNYGASLGVNRFAISFANDADQANVPLMYPYFLHDRKKIDDGYEWKVSQDVSGTISNAGKLRLYGKDQILIVDAPNEVVEDFVVQLLQLKRLAE